MEKLLAMISGGELSLLEICLRLLCAMAVGLVIGTEREYTHRPAGMRTHILVALGACSVMITGQLIFIHYKALGAMPDPARLGAQVITGVGFLGAGTIMREGSNVKGLTTAASLWAVACLGLAAGGGYYAVALLGMIFIFITLTIFEVIQNKLVGAVQDLVHYSVITRDLSACLNAINRLSQKHRAILQDIAATRLEEGFRIDFHAEVGGWRARQRRSKFLEDLIREPSAESVRAGETEESLTAP